MTEFRPDISYIHFHDTGRYKSPYGHKVTPPPRSFSRVALLTGEYANSCSIDLVDYSKRLLHVLHRTDCKLYLLKIKYIIYGTFINLIRYDEILSKEFASAVEIAQVACFKPHHSILLSSANATRFQYCHNNI
jgi:hypothetical protein